MKVIRVTKTSRNRIDAVCAGGNYYFLSPDFGLVAIVERETFNYDFNYYVVTRSEQISKETIESVIEEDTKPMHKVNRFRYKVTDKTYQHELPYFLDIQVNYIWGM